MELPADVRVAFARYVGGGTFMTAHQLRQFMIHEQCQPKTNLEDAETIARKILHVRHQRSQTFHNIVTTSPPMISSISSSLLSSIPPIPSKINSPSSGVPVIEALIKGVRVIELDTWPNKAKNDVLVLHGGLLVPLQKPVELVTCLRAIAQNAFFASTLPVIITFEDHLQPPLQAKVAEMLKQTLRNLLYIPKCDSERLENFASIWYVSIQWRLWPCGYVKKPDMLMTMDPHDVVLNPNDKLPVKKTLKVKVYMGDGCHLDFKQIHFDMYSPPDSTWIGISGALVDSIMKKTKKKEDDWTPVREKEFIFPLTLPELALLQIEVHEYDMSEKDDFSGQNCLPVSELTPGFHAIPLCNRKGEKYNNVRLLVRFEFV